MIRIKTLFHVNFSVENYKFPVETKKFYTDVAENVDNEIKSTGKGE